MASGAGPVRGAFPCNSFFREITRRDPDEPPIKEKNIMTGILRSLVTLILTAYSLSCGAQAYPNKPIRVIVGFPAGGSTDFVTRALSDRMSAQMGQTIVVDNRPGAGGLIGLDVVLKAERDGYMMGYLASPTLISALMAGRDINPDRDMTHIGLIYRRGLFLGLNPNAPEFKGVKTGTDLVAVIRANPGKINFGSIGIGSTGHLLGEMMKSSGKLDWMHVPYKGISQLSQESMAGLAPIVVMGTTVDDPKNSGGRMINVAVTSAQRHPGAPDVQTLIEAGFPGIDATTWGSFYAPAGIPQAAASRLAAEFKTAHERPEVQKQLAQFDPEYMAPAQLAVLARNHLQLWGKVIRDNNLQGK